MNRGIQEETIPHCPALEWLCGSVVGVLALLRGTDLCINVLCVCMGACECVCMCVHAWCGLCVCRCVCMHACVCMCFGGGNGEKEVCMNVCASVRV